MRLASLAILLAAVGLYGVLSYGVSQRVRELGIRAALGAQRIDLVRLVLLEGLSVTFVGIGHATGSNNLCGGAGEPRRGSCRCVPRTGAARSVDRSGDHATRSVNH